MGAWEFEEPMAVSNENLPTSSLTVNAFPNPSSSLVCVKFNAQGAGTIRASLYDAFGKKVSEIMKEKPVTAEMTAFFNAGDFIPGTYFLHVVSDKQRLVEKIVLF